jgi:hypothetical protein
MEQDNTEKYKKKIEEIFANLDVEKEKREAEEYGKHMEAYSEAASKEERGKRTVEKERLDDDSETSIQEFCRRKGLEELEIVRQAFVDFQDELKDLIVFEQLVPQIAEFAQYAISLMELVDEDLDTEHELDPEIQYKLETIRKIKAQLFTSLYNKYKKK